MLQNYIHIAWRHIRKHRFYFLLNVTGLAIGLGCAMVIILYVINELTYDAYHRDCDRSYRIAYSQSSLIGDNQFATSAATLAPLMRQQCLRS